MKDFKKNAKKSRDQIPSIKRPEEWPVEGAKVSKLL